CSSDGPSQLGHCGTDPAIHALQPPMRLSPADLRPSHLEQPSSPWASARIAQRAPLHPQQSVVESLSECRHAMGCPLFDSRRAPDQWPASTPLRKDTSATLRSACQDGVLCPSAKDGPFHYRAQRQAPRLCLARQESQARED